MLPLALVSQHHQMIQWCSILNTFHVLNLDIHALTIGSHHLELQTPRFQYWLPLTVVKCLTNLNAPQKEIEVDLGFLKIQKALSAHNP
nr:hypothetical protein Iba_chr15aCG0710 [Ipomoea batatas]